MSEYSDRQYVAKLLRMVRIGQLTVLQAMKQYPKDVTDESLIAAYHALIHYEADEEIRSRDDLYRQEQDDYLEFLSNVLASGSALPQNIIDNYKELYDYAPILHKNNLSGFLSSFWKILNIDIKNKK